MKQSPTRFGSPNYDQLSSLQINENNRKNSNFSEIAQNVTTINTSPSLLSRNLEKILEMEQKVKPFFLKK